MFFSSEHWKEKYPRSVNGTLHPFGAKVQAPGLRFCREEAKIIKNVAKKLGHAPLKEENVVTLFLFPFWFT